MISPRFSITAEVYIHAARGTVWQKFCQLQEWPRWDSQVIAAHWLDNPTPTEWQENARLQIQTLGRWGPRQETAIVRMVVPAATVVWESITPGINIVHSTHFADELGGCKLRVRNSYHGLAVFQVWLARGRQQRQLEETLHAFKEYIERR